MKNLIIEIISSSFECGYNETILLKGFSWLLAWTVSIQPARLVVILNIEL